MAQSIRNSLVLYIWCGVLVLISGCSSSGATPEQAASITPPQIVASVSTETPVSTSTSSPTPTEAPKPTETPTPLPSETLTPLPTFTKAERDEYIKEQLVTNGGCTLPCIWKLKPGEISWQEAQGLMAYMNIPVQIFLRESVNSHIAGFSLEENLSSFNGGLTFHEQDELVRIIEFGANDITQAPYYQIQNAIRDLGVPAYVGLDLRIKGPMGTPLVAIYDLIVRYGDTPGENGMERLWAELGYGGIAIKRGNSYQFCPTNPKMEGVSSASVSFRIPLGFSLSLQPPNSPTTVDEFLSLSGRDHLNEPPDIEAATGVSVQEFYDLILQSDQPPCFDTPIEFWPDR